ncbi:(E3-independent) E2 ubiquitin-conjugating enzyme UBE2O [Hemiscyllium ocellatum]|uniref:(E3-independent) E2 ubiquitin-conjugating enzyme UBE2O n=1 Tax=Hemiscyllium ocellatum TaxID=170820 RepID=UPI002966CF9A|nr:(E3-independent) E2 ubiquitin-conjugating enzyme UBE2O [Hemiscyllium ocellatum]XP_060700627.1 (E3-independent) E2 ubiquitin-conjugating enzyme UBE2O [Hemiscyllium ocellatum]
MEVDADLGIGHGPGAGDPGPDGRRAPGDVEPQLTVTVEPRPPVPASPSPAASPAQSPAPAPAPGSQRLLFVDDLVSGTYKGALRHGIVGLIHGEVSSGESSDTDEEGTGRERPLKKGYVRVQWYPEGGKQDVKEIKLKLEDRSLMPRDLVRRMGKNADNQCGTVIDVNMECTLKILGTNYILHPVNSRDLQHIWPFVYGDYIAFDCWLGKVDNIVAQLILKLSNGARCSMSTSDGSKLVDLCPHVSDSGQFFDESYGFYPGQMLFGAAKVFSNVQWLSGVRPVLSKKSKFKAVVEEVQVVELRVSWITKSFCLGGSESVYPPSPVITHDNLPRVKRLNCYDHARMVLAERAVYVLPGDPECSAISSEGPEGNSIIAVNSVVRKVKRLFDKEKVKNILNNLDTREMDHSDKFAVALGDGSVMVTSNVFGIGSSKSNLGWEGTPQLAIGLKSQPVNGTVEKESVLSNGPVFTNDDAPTQLEQRVKEENWKEMGQSPVILGEDLLESRQTLKAQLAEQDADDEGAEDTDETSSISSSASSTASSQSGGHGRKKSIPLSIKNLKKKHKKKKNKPSREFKPGDRIAVEILKTSTSVDVMWQDGTVEKDIRSNDLLPVHHVDNNEFCPGDFVLDKRAQGPQDVGVYGVVQSVDHIGRTCSVKWFKPKANGTEIEMLGCEEDISVYDIADHPDFHFRITDIVIRIGNVEEGRTLLNDNEEPSVGQVSRVDISGKVEVVWADNSKSSILPQHLYNVESDIEESDLDSLDGTSTGATSDEWEDDSDSWETDDGVTEDEIVKGSEALEVGIEVTAQSEESKTESEQAQVAGATSSSANLEKVAKDGSPKGFHEIKEAIKILESLKNMTVEQLMTGSATSPTVEPEKQTKDKKFRDDIKKLQETLQKTLDNVAIVEEEKMEAVVETENKEEKLEMQTPIKSEWSSDTPVLCQQSSKPGVTFTSAKGEVFSVLESVPESHAFKKMEFQPADSKKFFNTVRKEMALLATALPDGIMVKTFEDRMDLFSALIKGPTRTPYDDGLFLFDIQLPNVYPAVPPLFRYISQCSGRLNPNLYDNGKVCVSLLGTWIGKGTERWTSKSSLLQVLISIQGLILVNEPYYNEAGFDSDRGLQEGYENSRCYNEMALIKLVQSMTQLIQKPVEIFEQEIKEHFYTNGWRLVYRMESWLEVNEMIQRSIELGNNADDESIQISSDTADSRMDGLSPSAAQSVVESAQAVREPGIENSEDHVSSKPQTTLAEAGSDENICLETDSTEQQPTEACSLTLEQKGSSSQAIVRPKKRRKSYRSFLPEKRGYPDIGFPLFPLSKGFVKSICGCLQQYKATLIESGIPEKREER